MTDVRLEAEHKKQQQNKQPAIGRVESRACGAGCVHQHDAATTARGEIVFAIEWSEKNGIQSSSLASSYDIEALTCL